MSGVFHAAILFLVAAGLQVVFGVQKIFNLACGSFYALGAYAGVSAVTAFTPPAVRPHSSSSRSWRPGWRWAPWARWWSADCCASSTTATRPSSSC